MVPNIENMLIFQLKQEVLIVKIKERIERFKLKQDVLVAKGMVAEIYQKADWNDSNLTTEDQLKLNELMCEIVKAEHLLKS